MKTDCFFVFATLFLVPSLLSCQFREDKGITTVTPNFSSLHENVFSVTCLRCHSSINANGGFDVSTYETIAGSPDVVPGDPFKSKLYTKVFIGSMPLGGPMLPENAIVAIKTWIQNGALDD